MEKSTRRDRFRHVDAGPGSLQQFPARGPEKYYLVAVTTKLAYWQAAGAGLIKAAHGLGVAAEVVGPG